jgi:hypothetical protein
MDEDRDANVCSPGDSAAAENEGWSLLGMQRLEQEWDNPADAIYDDWKALYSACPGAGDRLS